MPAEPTSRRRRHHSKTAQPASALYGNSSSRLLAIPALVLAGLLCWHVFNVGMASAWYFKASNYVDLWIKNEKLFTEHSWQDATTAIDKAIELHPTHPHYLLVKAKINEWGWYGGLMTSQQLEQTENYYRQAIAMRPTWPNAYADYAYYLGVTQFRISESFEILEKARKFGPYMQETSLRTTSIGFSRWIYLNTQQKLQTLHALSLSVANSHSYAKALDIVKVTGKSKLACTYLKASNDSIIKSNSRDFCK
ncbi:hypothetical protein ACFO3I_17285 [Rheinheimera marina]|uniref:Tetratricopeptide repeat protein n=1 Tax=Rheinheimera marina TaxID=1774958 RepID=A0ABV9JRC3_9GAMM